jgi:hypothetical protein
LVNELLNFIELGQPGGTTMPVGVAPFNQWHAAGSQPGFGATLLGTQQKASKFFLD